MTTRNANEQRIETEKAIVRRYIDELLEAGFTLDVNDGDVITLRRNTDPTAILDALFTTDEDYLIARDADGKKVGWVRFVYGNEPWEVVSDSSTSLCDVLRPADEFAAEFAAHA